MSGQVSEELWKRKSVELEAELQRVRAEMEQHEHASHQYEATGLQILELAQNAYSLYLTESAHEQARLVKMLLSNCKFDRGSLSPILLSRSTCSRKVRKLEIGSPHWTISATTSSVQRDGPPIWRPLESRNRPVASVELETHLLEGL